MLQRAFMSAAALALVTALAACSGSGARHASADGSDRRAYNGPIGDYSPRPFATKPSLFARPDYAHSDWDLTAITR